MTYQCVNRHLPVPIRHFENRLFLLLTEHVRGILLVLSADEFENVGAEQQMHSLYGRRPWFGVGLRVVDGRLQFQMSKIRTPKPFCDMKRLGGRMTLCCVKPRLIVET